MPLLLVDGVHVKAACVPCIRGHRVGGCEHFQRIMIQTRTPGRPQLAACACSGTGIECHCNQPSAYVIPGHRPMVLPEKHENQAVIYNAVRSNARLQFDILKHPGSKKRHVKIEAEVVGKGKEKASAESPPEPGSPIRKFPNVPTPYSNDIREYKSVSELAARMHSSHDEGDSGEVAPCACCQQAAYRLMNAPKVEGFVQEDPANMSTDSDSTEDVSDGSESPIREGKRTKRNADAPELLLTQPFKPQTPTTYQPNQPSSLQQVQYQSDIQDDLLSFFPPDPMIHYPASEDLPLPEVDQTHFGHNPTCAEGTLKGIYPIYLANQLGSNDFCPCPTQDDCGCVGCADHPGNPATIRHVMAGFNFQATDAYYNNPDFVMPDVPANDDKAPAPDNVAVPGHGCCVKMKTPSNGFVPILPKAPTNPSHPYVPIQPGTDLAARFPTLSLDQNKASAAPSEPITAEQEQYLQGFSSLSRSIPFVRKLLLDTAHLPRAGGKGDSSRTPASAIPLAEHIRRGTTGEMALPYLEATKASLQAVAEAKAEHKRKGTKFTLTLQHQIEREASKRVFAKYNMPGPHDSETTISPSGQAQKTGGGEDSASFSHAEVEGQEQVMQSQSQSSVSSSSAGQQTSQVRPQPISGGASDAMKPQGQRNGDDESMNLQTENLQPPGQSSHALSSAGLLPDYIPTAFETQYMQTQNAMDQLSASSGFQEQYMQLPTQFQAQYMQPQGQSEQASTDAQAQFLQSLLGFGQDYVQDQGQSSGQASSSAGLQAPYLPLLPDFQAQYMQHQSQGGQASSSTGVYSQPEIQTNHGQASTNEPQHTGAQGQTSAASAMDFQTQYVPPQQLQTQGQGGEASSSTNFQPQTQYTPNPLTLGSIYSSNLMPGAANMTYAQLQAMQKQLLFQQQQVQAALDQQVFNMPFHEFFGNNTVNNTNNQQNFIMYGGVAPQNTTGFVEPTMQAETIDPSVLQQGQNDTVNPSVLQQGQNENDEGGDS